MERRAGKVRVGFFHLWTTDAQGRRVRTKKEKTLGAASMSNHEAQRKLADYISEYTGRLTKQGDSISTFGELWKAFCAVKSGHTNIRTENNWLFFNVEGLNSDFHLETAMSMLIANAMAERASGKSGQPSIPVLDECWSLLDSPVLAPEVVQLFRTARKRHSSVWEISQTRRRITRRRQAIQFAAKGPGNRRKPKLCGWFQPPTRRGRPDQHERSEPHARRRPDHRGTGGRLAGENACIHAIGAAGLDAGPGSRSCE
jgi:hypothetical protein